MFKFLRNLNGRNTNVGEEMPTTAGEKYIAGEALVLTGGKLTKCGATAKPVYIAGEDYDAPLSGNKMLYCHRIMDGHEYEVPLSATGTSLKAGDKVQIHTDGLSVTATTGGAAEIIRIHGTKIGETVVVKF